MYIYYLPCAAAYPWVWIIKALRAYGRNAIGLYIIHECVLFGVNFVGFEIGALENLVLAVFHAVMYIPLALLCDHYGLYLRL